ncbi:acetoacetate--CoA ligase (plasmid) [Shinella sumterensis]|uniref:Acetoacetate--CoA ligase n=2 Tax=Hyphomicrobiales TaxID=356 RepID=A0AA50HJG7_9HYPH|nr:acetoacetate--CoA ligase [Shinella sumterensis]WLS01080.1 acetoacetate--CoA ligase [Shinella sumterensis]WLS11873.1 acetoacetate--CoA ligase [Shinella sumterensis]
MPLWTPSEQSQRTSPLHEFQLWCAERGLVSGAEYEDLFAWSVSKPAEFWEAIWDFCGVKGDRGDRVLLNGDDMLRARFFPDATLNFAENLLTRAGDEDALVFRGEDKVEYRWSWDRLRREVSRLQQVFAAMGIEKGDRIAAMMPNMPEAIACMLATASIGAVWSSCSPDFGEQGVLDRFGQIEPKLFIACDGYWYNGKQQDVSAKVRAVSSALNVPVLVISYLGNAAEVAATLSNALTWEDIAAQFKVRAIKFEQVPFSHPLYILFSSGTTGVPKCIVHSAGGTLLQHLKEQRLHCGVRPGERIFYFTTCGWMMWNWLASGLASQATLCLYDGSPFAPNGNVLFDYAQDERFSFFGTSAKYIETLRKGNFLLKDSHHLPFLRTIASTGSPLAPEGYAYVYEAIKRDVHLASISGGTDIVSCFVLGNPVKPVWSGELQGPGLGLAVDVWDDDGKTVRGEKGELVCTKPFPAMPLMFWNDPEGDKYRAAYFERFENVWCHGDFAEWTSHDGIIIHGRSDTTLNPGGVRIGTAEIYNQVEQLEEVVEALCIGQDWDGDVRVVLFVRLATNKALDEELERKIRTKIRTGASPRHVPAKIVGVPDIPRTKSGKIVELAVREIVHGRPVKNKEALSNPESLHFFEAIPSLQY